MMFARIVSLSWIRAGLVLGAMAAMARAQGGSPLAEVVALPEFKVMEDRPLPPREEWRYVKLGNFEVLSSTSERITKEFVRDLREFQIVLNAISPHMLIQAELPVMVVLCGRGGQFDRFAVKTTARSTAGRGTTLLRDNETAAIVLDYTARTFGEEVMLPPAFQGGGAMNGVTLLGRREIHTSEEFIRQYVHLSLSQMTPRLPAWAAEGMANIYGDIEYNNKWIQVGLPKSFRDEVTVETAGMNSFSSVWGQGGVWDSSLGGSLYRDATTGIGMPMMNAPMTYVARLYLMPMDKLFAVGYDSALFTGATDREGMDLHGWRKQATAFVHMCVYGRGGRYRKGFVKFTTLTAQQPATEALFKECFGKTYKEMLMELRGYTEFTDYEATTYKPGKGENILLPAPKIEVRPATDGEIGRIKGETLRLAGQDELARNEFVVAYLRGDRDPQLLASLGLMARLRKDDARAKTYLEAVGAAPMTIPRPRAYLELARLRFAQHRAANGGGPLDLQQLTSVLTPLFAAQKLPQQLADVYREVARAWDNTTVVPQREHLAVLEHGIALMPRNGNLIVETAALLIKHGYRADAAPLVLRALNNTKEPELKARLEKLKEQIDAVPGGPRTGGVGEPLRFSPEAALAPEVKQRLEAFRTARATAASELRAKLGATATLAPAARERELAAFAIAQTPRLQELESDAGRLEAELGWPPDDGEDYGFGWEEPGGSGEGGQLAVLRSALVRPQGLSPPQQGLLREMILDADDGAASRGAFLFFSPATARVRLGADAALPAELTAHVAEFAREKAVLKDELRALLQAGASTPGSALARSAGLSALGQQQAKRFEALETLAESIRRGLAKLGPTRESASAMLPPALATRLVAYQQERSGVQRDLRRELRTLREQAAGSDVEIVASGEPPQLALKASGRAAATAAAGARASLQSGIEAFNRRYAERFGALEREAAALRREIGERARATPGARGKSVDDLMRDFAGAALRQTAADVYRDFRAAVLEPGLSPEQRRLLFGRTGEKQPTLIIEP